jgi:hypothetical protein
MTVRFDILNTTTMFDDGVYPSILDEEMTLTNAKEQACIVMAYPTGTDIGVHLAFEIPQNYSSAPAIILRGVIDGSPANTLGVAAQQLSRADSEAVDTAYETEDTASNGTWTGYADEDEYEISITLTPAAAYVAGDTVYLWVYRDDNVDTTTWNFLVTRVIFSYTES